MYERDIISIPWRLRIVRLFMYGCVLYSHLRFNLAKEPKNSVEMCKNGRRQEEKNTNFAKNFLSENPQFAQLLIYYLTVGMVGGAAAAFFLVCYSPWQNRSSERSERKSMHVFSFLNFKDSTRRFASFECTHCTGDRSEYSWHTEHSNLSFICTCYNKANSCDNSWENWKWLCNCFCAWYGYYSV